jgi:hypothetical protein
MAAFDYAAMALSADDLLVEFGAAATLTRTTAGAYDPETGTSTPETVTTQNVTAVCIDYAAEFIDGSLIQRGDKQVFLSPKDITAPAAGDKFTWQGAEYSVIAVTPLSPAGTVVLYELQARR